MEPRRIVKRLRAVIKVLINNERVKDTWSGEMEESKQASNCWKTLIESFKLSELANVYLLCTS